MRLVWSDSLAAVYKDGSSTGSLLFREHNSYSPYGSAEERKNFGSERFTVLSIAGPTISFATQWYAEGGAHPSYGTSFTAFDIQTLRPANLLSYFSEEQLLRSFMNDSLLKPRIPKDANIRSLADFFKKVDGGCELAILPNMLESFAFHHIKDSNVAIRIGISHGCEVNRGDFHQIGFYLPIPAKLNEYLRDADSKKTLMNSLPPQAFMK